MADLAVEHPAHGQKRRETVLAMEGRRMSLIAIQKILSDNGLGTRHDCWLALELVNAGETLGLSTEQTAFLEERNLYFRERDVDSAAAGNCSPPTPALSAPLKASARQSSAGVTADRAGEAREEPSRRTDVGRAPMQTCLRLGRGGHWSFC